MTILLGIATAFLVATSLLPLLPVAHGIVRVGDFPRQQVIFLAVVLLAVSAFAAEPSAALRVIQLVLAAVALTQFWHILPYTRLWRRETADFHPGRDEGHAFRLMAANVKMSNRDYDTLRRVIEERKPDIVILMEVDEPWAEALRPALEAFTEVVAQPQENSYGMLLASKFPLSDTGVQYLLTDGVPSIITTVSLTEEDRFRLYAIHPEPPVPHMGTEGRDGETSLVALRVREEKLPVIVTGDLNDVAWSLTTRRFRKVSRLLDPRIGRTVFSTFDARYPLARWPLDHLFHSPEFRLKDMHRLPAGGSDHFPVEFDLVLCERPKSESRPEKANGEDIERARELAQQARERDEEPIGSDWEKPA